MLIINFALALFMTMTSIQAEEYKAPKIKLKRNLRLKPVVKSASQLDETEYKIQEKPARERSLASDKENQHDTENDSKRAPRSRRKLASDPKGPKPKYWRPPRKGHRHKKRPPRKSKTKP